MIEHPTGPDLEADAVTLLRAVLARQANQGQEPELRLAPEDLERAAEVDLEIVKIRPGGAFAATLIIRPRRDPRHAAIRHVLEVSGGPLPDVTIEELTRRILDELDRLGR